MTNVEEVAELLHQAERPGLERGGEVVERLLRLRLDPARDYGAACSGAHRSRGVDEAAGLDGDADQPISGRAPPATIPSAIRVQSRKQTCSRASLLLRAVHRAQPTLSLLALPLQFRSR